MSIEEDVLTLHANYHAVVEEAGRRAMYRDQLSSYAADIIADICTRKTEQWELLSRLEPGIVLFSFANHQRIVFSRQADRLSYRFRTYPYSRRLTGYSFRCLWLIQSPVFQDAITTASPLVDKGSIYLTFAEESQTFYIRVCWTDEPYLPEGEVLIQSLVEYDIQGEALVESSSSSETPAVEEA